MLWVARKLKINFQQICYPFYELKNNTTDDPNDFLEIDKIESTSLYTKNKIKKKRETFVPAVIDSNELLLRFFFSFFLEIRTLNTLQIFFRNRSTFHS